MSEHYLILGNPCGKPRMTRRDKWKKRACVMNYRSWADEARTIVFGNPMLKQRLSRPTKVDIIASFEIPKSQQKKVKPDDWHTVTPDADNLQKSVFDALFENDQMIVDVTCLKKWALVPSVSLTITSL